MDTFGNLPGGMSARAEPDAITRPLAPRFCRTIS